jgi:hypothetical protein
VLAVLRTASLAGIVTPNVLEHADHIAGRNWPPEVIIGNRSQEATQGVVVTGVWCRWYDGLEVRIVRTSNRTDAMREFR